MKKTFSYEQDVTTFFLLLALVFGAIVRFFPIFKADFPLVDGGMFYAMIQDLQEKNFAIPQFTSYNQANIPFAYPPLGFYLAGFLNSTTGMPLLEILRWFPALTTLLTIPIFYYFVKQIFKSPPKAALGALVFSLVPNSYWWNIVGGGLTRALGTFFFAATILSLYQMYTLRSRKWIFLSITSAAGAVLSHPAWALQSIVAAGVLWFCYGKDKRGVIYSVVVVIGVVLLTSPWWFAVLQNHGVEIFLNAAQGTYSRWKFWTIFFTLSFTDEYTPVIAVFSLCGLFIHLARKDYFLPAWILLALFADPRGGIPAAILPFTMMAATLLADGIASSFVLFPDVWLDSLKSFAGRLFFGFFTILFAYNAFQVSNTLSYQVLSVEERGAINWIKENTRQSDRFLIFDDQPNPLHSPLTEWFPALAERRSAATIQGSEWLEGEKNYISIYDAIFEVHQCIYKDVECVDKLQPGLPDGYDYVMISNIGNSPLASSLKDSQKFKLIYFTEEVQIFRLEN